MKCNRCGGDRAFIIEEDDPVRAWQVLLAILLFPIGLIFVVCRGARTVKICPECGFKEEI